jgi:outer membrane protein assembly factor BamA
MKLILSLLICCAVGPLAHGQFVTRWKLDEDFTHFGIHKENVPKGTPDQILRHMELELMLQGYYNAQIDTVTHHDTLYFSLQPGSQIYLPITSVHWKSPHEEELVTTQSQRHGSTLPDLQKQIERILTEAENQGYPFASVYLDDLEKDSTGIHLSMSVNLGPIIQLDTVIGRSLKPLPMSAIRSALFLRKGQPYRQHDLEKIDERLKRIPYLQWRQPTEIQFNPNSYRIYLFAEPRSANRVQAIIGLRPDPKTGKSTIIGDIDTQWKNALKYGEEISFTWRKLQPQTQDLKVKVEFPFLGPLPVGISGEWMIYKRDSTFASSDFSAGLLFQPEYGQRLKGFIRRLGTTALATSTYGITGNTATTYYGGEYTSNQLNHLWNPSSGYAYSASLSWGNRRTLNANDVALETPAKSQNLLAAANFEWYIPTFKSQCIRLAVQGKSLSGQQLYVNELLRFGGLRTMRGINEESIFCTTYGLASLEYRLLLDENSAVLLFSDWGMYESHGITPYVRDTPISVGFGLQIGTKGGIFSMQYGIARQFDQPMAIRNANVSLGYSNTF